MASLLKRKRGPVEIAETPKRTKSENETPTSINGVIDAPANWDTALNSEKTNNEIALVNGVNGSASDKSKPENYDESMSAQQVAKSKQKASKTKSNSTWRTSEAVGGRMIDVDPIFVADEKSVYIQFNCTIWFTNVCRFLIVAHRLSLQIYSTSNSLLVRSIPIAVDRTLENHARIVAYCQSPSAPEFLWVACSDGSIFHVNWTSGEGATQFWTCSSTGVIHMAVASMNYGGTPQDVVYTTEKRREAGWRITAHELNPKTKAAAARTIYSSPRPIQVLKAVCQGETIVAASENRILLGTLKSADFKTMDKMRYEFRVIESTDYIATMDVRISPRVSVGGSKQAKKDSTPGHKMKKNVVDVVVGDVRGVVFVHNDLLAKLFDAQKASVAGTEHINLAPRKLHWHRSAVHSVKWSLDGINLFNPATNRINIR
jgi:NET1-associated nuclear protein 1 (U3 small nucleolar RNA-associated protein 17)